MDQQNEMRSARGGRWAAAYVVLVLCVPIMGILGVLWLAHTDWFSYHDNYFAIRNMGYSLSLHHEDCQVVLMGDSSALTGLDPLTVTRVTGLSACNLSETGPVQVVVGLYALDAYLKQNAPPKYIVFLGTPRLYTTAPSWEAYGTYNEGVMYLLRYMPVKSFLQYAVHHRGLTFHFAQWAAHGVFDDMTERLVHPHRYDGIEDPMLRRVQHRGLFTYYAGPETRCIRNGVDLQWPIFADPAWVAAVRAKYSVNGTRVMMDVSPVPDCDDKKEQYIKALQGLHDNAFEVMPIGMFNDGDVHFTPEGARHVSEEVAEQILAGEKKAGGH